MVGIKGYGLWLYDKLPWELEEEEFTRASQEELVLAGVTMAWAWPQAKIWA